jgi:prepilin-type N-terminal cleavage/methylation domain
MFGTCRGFTLIEVLVALSVLVITFSVLFELLLSARKDYELAKSLYQDMSLLNNKFWKTGWRVCKLGRGS